MSILNRSLLSRSPVAFQWNCMVLHSSLGPDGPVSLKSHPGSPPICRESYGATGPTDRRSVRREALKPARFNKIRYTSFDLRRVWSISSCLPSRWFSKSEKVFDIRISTYVYICYSLLSQPFFQDKKAVKRSSDSQSNTMFASLVMKPICDFYDSVYMDLDRDRLRGMRKQIKAISFAPVLEDVGVKKKVANWRTYLLVI